MADYFERTQNVWNNVAAVRHYTDGPKRGRIDVISSVRATFNKIGRLLGSIFRDLYNLRSMYKTNQRIKKQGGPDDLGNTMGDFDYEPQAEPPPRPFGVSVTHSALVDLDKSIDKVNKDQKQIDQDQDKIAQDQDKIAKDQDKIAKDQDEIAKDQAEVREKLDLLADKLKETEGALEQLEKRNPVAPLITPPPASDFEAWEAAPKPPPTVVSPESLSPAKVADPALAENLTHPPEEPDEATMKKRLSEKAAAEYTQYMLDQMKILDPKSTLTLLPNETVTEFAERLKKDKIANQPVEPYAPDKAVQTNKNTKAKYPPLNPEAPPASVAPPEKNAGMFAQLGNAMKNIKNPFSQEPSAATSEKKPGKSKK